MAILFEIEDPLGKKVHLSKERWLHIIEEHPELASALEDIQDTLKRPLKHLVYELDGTVRYVYNYFKHRKSAAKYLLIIVKYLNGTGFVITAYYVRQIQ